MPRTPPGPWRGRAGFTLAELLIAIGIIGVLVALLFPALREVQERANRTACLANLRSLGQAMTMYANEHRGRLPNRNPPGTVLDPVGVDAALVALNDGYVNAPAAFHCPSDSEDDVPRSIETGAYLKSNSARVSYEFYSPYWLPEMGPLLVRIKDAPLAWDLHGAAAGNKRQNHGSRGGNVVHGDGHAAWQPAEQWDGSNWPSPADRYYE